MTVTTMQITGAHPYANKFPVLPDDEMAELAESIKANGLRQPVVVTEDGLILDGRNRAAACALLGIEPETVVYEGDDLAEYVIDCNVTRRNMSTGARAMATALVLEADGRRNGGRWKRGSVDIAQSSNTESAWQTYLAKSGVVLDYAFDLAEQVVSGGLALDAAYREAKAKKDSAEHEKVRARELAKREREEAKADAERNSRIVADLTTAGQDRYLDLIHNNTLTPAAAWSAYQEDTRKERLLAAEHERGLRDTCTRIAECSRFLEGGASEAERFLTSFYPHEHRFLAEGMRLTRTRIQANIDYLTVLLKGVSE